MTTRNDMVYLDADDPFPVTRERVKKELHKVYPVFENDKDNILGIITLKDLYVGAQDESYQLKPHLKSVNYLDQATSAYKALEHFKATRTKYALVTNEYGIVLGIITIDDILKALVGDVSEFYTEDFPLVQREDGSWLVDGEYPLAEFALYFEIGSIKEWESINTVGGLILHLMHRIPKAGEKVNWKDLDLEVMDMDGIKIDKVLVKKR